MIYGWILLAVLITWGLWEYSLLYNEVKEWTIKQYTKMEEVIIKIGVIEGQLVLDEETLRTFDLDREELEKEREELLKKFNDLSKEEFPKLKREEE